MTSETSTVDPNEADYRVGPGQPPLHSRWQKGTSGNPHGRPRRSGASGRRMPYIPELARALERRVETAYQGEGYQQVSLAEMLVNELTHMVTSRHNVAAARELMNWIGETACARAEIEAEEVAAAAEAEAAERAARKAGEAEALARERLAQREALERLRALAGEEHAEDCDGHCDGQCIEDSSDLQLTERAIVRLGIGVLDGEGELRLKPWAVEAALARAPDEPLNEGERATVALVTAAEETERDSQPDWETRLEEVVRRSAETDLAAVIPDA